MARFHGTREQHSRNAKMLTQQSVHISKQAARERSCERAIGRLVHAALVLGAAGRDRDWAGEVNLVSDTFAPGELELRRAQASVVRRCR